MYAATSAVTIRPKKIATNARLRTSTANHTSMSVAFTTVLTSQGPAML